MLASLSIVIPVYRSAAGLHILIDELEACCPMLAEQYEIILVDDGSPDSELDAIQTPARKAIPMCAASR